MLACKVMITWKTGSNDVIRCGGHIMYRLWTERTHLGWRHINQPTSVVILIKLGVLSNLSWWIRSKKLMAGHRFCLADQSYKSCRSRLGRAQCHKGHPNIEANSSYFGQELVKFKGSIVYRPVCVREPWDITSGFLILIKKAITWQLSPA